MFMGTVASPVDTVCHGDFWSNNILFSYKEAEGEEKILDDLIIIDYQLINYGHPCYDLVYFLYLNTDLAFRDAHVSYCVQWQVISKFITCLVKLYIRCKSDVLKAKQSKDRAKTGRKGRKREENGLTQIPGDKFFGFPVKVGPLGWHVPQPGALAPPLGGGAAGHGAVLLALGLGPTAVADTDILTSLVLSQACKKI